MHVRPPYPEDYSYHRQRQKNRICKIASNDSSLGDRLMTPYLQTSPTKLYLIDDDQKL